MRAGQLLTTIHGTHSTEVSAKNYFKQPLAKQKVGQPSVMFLYLIYTYQVPFWNCGNFIQGDFVVGMGLPAAILGWARARS